VLDTPASFSDHTLRTLVVAGRIAVRVDNVVVFLVVVLWVQGGILSSSSISFANFISIRFCFATPFSSANCLALSCLLALPLARLASCASLATRLLWGIFGFLSLNRFVIRFVNFFRFGYSDIYFL